MGGDSLAPNLAHPLLPLLPLLFDDGATSLNPVPVDDPQSFGVLRTRAVLYTLLTLARSAAWSVSRFLQRHAAPPWIDSQCRQLLRIGIAARPGIAFWRPLGAVQQLKRRPAARLWVVSSQRPGRGERALALAGSGHVELGTTGRGTDVHVDSRDL